MIKRKMPQYVQAFVDRHGKPRHYFKRPGVRVALPGMPYSTEFMDGYAAARKVWEQGQRSPTTVIGAQRIRPGTFAALIASYYRSSEFLTLKLITQSTYRNRIEKIREEHGDRLVADLQREHVKALMAKKAATPDSANRLLKTLRVLMRHALDIRLCTTDPCHRIKKFKTGSDGYRTWTEAEIDQFYAAHPKGSRARLALDLLLYTGQRRQDIVRMGRQHLRGDVLVVKQSKSGSEVSIPVNGRFKELLDDLPRDRLCFIVGVRGLPLTAESFGNEFREWREAAGLPVGLAPHGLRKAVCRRLADAGCSANEIMSISGHRNHKEIATYTQAADAKRLANTAMATVSAFTPKDELGTSSVKPASTV